MFGANKHFLGLLTFALGFIANAENRKWVCDSGFKNSFGASYISLLRPTNNDSYDLYIGYQPGDTSDAQTQEPVLVEKNLKCSFDPENDKVVLCSNGLSVGAWSRFKSSYVESNETSINEDFTVGKNESKYVRVVYSSGNEAKHELIKNLGGERYSISYSVNPKFQTTKCGFEK